MFIVAQEVDCMQQEADYVIDAFLLLCLAYLWATQLSHLRSRDTYAYVAIICCIKMSFFADQSSSLNFTTDDTLSEMRAMLKSTPLFNVTAPLIGMIILENKINRHHNFGLFNKLMTHSITFALFYYYFVLYTQQPKILASQTEHSLALEAEYGQKLKMVGNCIYAAIIFCCMVSFLYFKMIKNNITHNIWFEFKFGKNKQTPEQIEFEKKCNQAKNEAYYLVDNVEKAIKVCFKEEILKN
jgi:hypothetical protein